MTCEVVSLSVELIRVKIDAFNNIIKNGSLVWQHLEKQTDEMQNNLTKRILAQSKMKNVIKNQYTQLVSNTNTDWQYCPVEQLIQQKNEYDRFVAE